MTTTDLFTSVSTLPHELTHGAAPTGGFVLNRGDAGLLASLGKMPAIAVAHVAYHMGAIRQIQAAARGPKHEAT
jgi:hypothetical protein